jgi:hypothetical protein
MTPDLAALEAAYRKAHKAERYAHGAVDAAEAELKLAQSTYRELHGKLFEAQCAWEGAKIALALQGDDEAIARLRFLRAISIPGGHAADQRLIDMGALTGGSTPRGYVTSTPAGRHALLVLDLGMDESGTAIKVP